MAFNRKETVGQKKKKEAQKVTLGDGQSLDQYLKPIKIGGVSSPLELASSIVSRGDSNVFDKIPAKVRIDGDLEVTGDMLVREDSKGVIDQVSFGSGSDIRSYDSGNAVFLVNGGTNVTTAYNELTETTTVNVASASDTAKGAVELATTAETTTGTSTTLAVTPDGLKDGYQGSSNITTTGALNSGSITSGFGAIDVGSSAIETTGSIGGGNITATNSLRSNGTILVSSPTLTIAGSDDYSISCTQTLNVGLAALGTQEYRQIKTNLTQTDATGWDNIYLIDQQVGGTSKFKVDNAGNATFAGTVTATGVTGASETFICNKRFTLKSDTNKWVGGYANNYYKSSEVWGLGTAKSGDNYTDTTMTAWTALSYADFTVANDCTVTKFVCSAYQNTSDVDFVIGLWKLTPTASTTHTTSAAVDFIGSIEFTANADTSTLHAAQTLTSFESGASLSAGDSIMVFGTLGSGGTGSDYSYWWSNAAITVTY